MNSKDTETASARGKLAPHGELILDRYAQGATVADIRLTLAGLGVEVGHPALSRWIKHRIDLKSKRAIELQPLLAEATKLVAKAANLTSAMPASAPTPTKTSAKRVESTAGAPPTAPIPDAIQKKKYEVGSLGGTKKSAFAEMFSESVEEDTSPSAVHKKST